MPADVAQAGRAEQRVGDGVQQRIGVGMAEQAARVRNLHAAQDQLAALHQRVHVVALADADVHPVHACESSWVGAAPARMASASAKSSG